MPEYFPFVVAIESSILTCLVLFGCRKHTPKIITMKWGKRSHIFLFHGGGYRKHYDTYSEIAEPMEKMETSSLGVRTGS